MILTQDFLEPIHDKMMPDLFDGAIHKALSVLGSVSRRHCEAQSLRRRSVTAHAHAAPTVDSPLPPRTATSIVSPLAAFSHTFDSLYPLPSCTRLRLTFHRPYSFSIRASGTHAGSGGDTRTCTGGGVGTVMFAVDPGRQSWSRRRGGFEAHDKTSASARGLLPLLLLQQQGSWSSQGKKLLLILSWSTGCCVKEWRGRERRRV